MRSHSCSGVQLTSALPTHPCVSPILSQGGATAGAAAAATAEAVREKETKINELIEELGNKELLLSEAQSQLAAVREPCWSGRVWQVVAACLP